MKVFAIIALVCALSNASLAQMYNGLYNYGRTANYAQNYRYRTQAYVAPRSAPVTTTGTGFNLNSVPELNKLGTEGIQAARELLPATGSVVSNVGGVPFINTKFGSFEVINQHAHNKEARAKLLPALRALVAVLEKDQLTAEDTDALLSYSRDLMDELPGVLPGF